MTGEDIVDKPQSASERIIGKIGRGAAGSQQQGHIGPLTWCMDAIQGSTRGEPMDDECEKSFAGGQVATRRIPRNGLIHGLDESDFLTEGPDDRSGSHNHGCQHGCVYKR